MWYAQIAEHGYQYSATHMSSMGFYPAYPLAIRAAMFIVSNPYVAGEILSALFLAAAAVLLAIWMHDRGWGDRAPLAMVILLMYPFSLFFAAAYSESMFLMLLLAVWVSFERRLWYLAAVSSVLLVLTRPTGVVVIPLLLLLRQRHGIRGLGSLLPPLAAVGGLAGFAVYQWIAFGTPLAYERAKFVPGWNTDMHHVVAELLLQSSSGYSTSYLAIMLAALVLAVALLPLVYSRLGLAAALLVVMLLALPLSAGLQSLTRYVSVCFPIFCALATIERRERLLLAAGPAALLSAGAAMLFAAGYGIY
ncbi:MAG TPA: hypothetical protein VFB58_16705 [Chloroflexota bacterium]|nr:hypothetical protein [Chloroflexota bacterium]